MNMWPSPPATHSQPSAHTPPAGWTHGWIRKWFSWLPWEQWVGRGPRDLRQPTGIWEFLNSQRVSRAQRPSHAAHVARELRLERHSPKEAGRVLPSWVTNCLIHGFRHVSKHWNQKLASLLRFLCLLYLLIYLLTFRKCIFKGYLVEFLPNGRPSISLYFGQSYSMIAALTH